MNSFPGYLALRCTPAEELVASYGHMTSELFEDAARMIYPNIVVLPTCNEQDDLPAALLSLSHSSVPVVAVVVENGSDADDKTFEYAARMGAIALRCEPAKMRATQVGLRYAREHYPSQPVVQFADGDNLFPVASIPTLARAARKANQRNDRKGAVVIGMGAYEHGPSVVVDLMRSGRVLRKSVERRLKGRQPMPYGFNYAVHIDEEDEVSKAICALDPRLFVREESAICAAAVAVGATVTQTVRPGAYVFTRGDRIRTREEWRKFKGASMAVKTAYYKRDYPGVDFLPYPNGRNKS